MKHCRLCGYPNMFQFLDLGFTPHADRFIKKEQLDEPETYYPLKVVRCDHCNFIQLSYVVPSEILYQNDYPYEASMTMTGQAHFDAFAESAMEFGKLSKGDLVVDIGSNVGVLLEGFKKRGCRVLGIDPAENIAIIAEKHGIPTIADFFSQKVVRNAVEKCGKAKLITASNVFAHIDDLHSLMEGIDDFLDDDGIFIVEAPYLLHLINNLEYDTIYHEHLSYLSLTPLASFFNNCGYELFDAKQVDIHGGSIRLFISRKEKRKVTANVTELLEYETGSKIHSNMKLLDFAQKVEKNRENLVGLLRSLKRNGKKIAGVSAPAKGMTLLNYCDIGSELIEFLTEKSELKIGRYAPGNHLPVMPDSALLSEDIEYALLLAWNFKDEIIGNLSKFKKKGGKFIIPIPEPIIL